MFFLLASTFFTLCGGVRNETVDKVAGWFGLVTAATAYWLAAAELFNDIIGEGKREIIPLGHFQFMENPAGRGGVHATGRIQPVDEDYHLGILRKSRMFLRHSMLGNAADVSHDLAERVRDVETGETQQ